MIDDFALPAQLLMCWTVAIAIVILRNRMQLLAEQLVLVPLLG
jgi:hypothetical protein